MTNFSEICDLLERVRGIEPLQRDWKSLVLPLHHTRGCGKSRTRTRIRRSSGARRDHLGYLASSSIISNNSLQSLGDDTISYILIKHYV